MKELTNEEKILVGTLWDAGYGINGIASIISDKRKDMDMYYLCGEIADELTGRVSIGDRAPGKMLDRRVKRYRANSKAQGEVMDYMCTLATIHAGVKCWD